MTVNELKKIWQQQLLALGKSDNTIIAYSKDIDNLFSFLKKHFACFEITCQQFANLTVQDLRSFMAFRYDQEYSSLSQARVISSIRSMANFMIRRKMIEDHAVFLLEKRRNIKKTPDIISEKEIYNAIKYLISKTMKDWSERRDRFLIIMLYCSGLRISELLCIKCLQVNNRQEFLLIKGKGNKSRKVPMLKFINKFIVDYCSSCPFISLKYEGFLFLNKKGEPLNRRTAYQIVHNFFENFSSKSYSPHDLRRSYASHLARNGANTRKIQILLGHSRIETTQHYVYALEEQVLKDYHTFAPNIEINKIQD